VGNMDFLGIGAEEARSDSANQVSRLPG